MPSESGLAPIISDELEYVQRISQKQEMLIGRAIATWSGVEQVIEEVIWCLLNLSPEEGRVVTSPLDGKFKLNLLRGLGRKRLNRHTFKSLNDAVKELRILYERRCLFAHGIWVTTRPKNIPAALSLRAKIPEQFDQADVVATLFPRDLMVAIIYKMKVIANALVGLRNELSASRDTQSEPHWPD
jgi:hypothetical protein